jgi:hypothetical protein
MNAKALTWDMAHYVLTDELMTTPEKATDILLDAEMNGSDTRVVGYGELATTHNAHHNSFTLSMREL